MLLVTAILGTIAIVGYHCGHEVGFQRHLESYNNIRAYAILLEKQNNHLNKRLKRKTKCLSSQEK